jgi:hypothetical protein
MEEFGLKKFLERDTMLVKMEIPSAKMWIILMKIGRQNLNEGIVFFG